MQCSAYAPQIWATPGLPSEQFCLELRGCCSQSTQRPVPGIPCSMLYRKWPPHHRGNTVTAFTTCTSLPLAATHLGEVGNACVGGLTMYLSPTRPPTDSMP